MERRVRIQKGKQGSQLKLRVLIVEDHPVNMKIMRFMLEKKDCEIYEATNGVEAVDLFQKVLPHLIFMDMQMPVMDGLKAAEEIRRLDNEQKSGKRTTIIALTASVSQEERADSIDAGIDIFLAKPLTYEKLSEIIKGTNPLEMGISPEYTVFDYKGLIELFSGNKNLVDKLIDEFLMGSITTLAKLDIFVTHNDYASIENLAHSLKGQLLNMKAGKAAKEFSKLEKKAAQNNKEIDSCYNSCLDSINELRDEIEKINR
ncbi:MAG: response regulator [Spirochaetaceae bacterium]|nr:response regulator [Spirochaetaceae bacterium]